MNISRHQCSSLLLVGIFLAVSSSSQAFTKLGRGTLNATAKLGFEYDDNIFGNAQGVGDYSAIFTPGLSYSRSVGVISTTAELGIRTISFTDTSGQDSLDPYLNMNFSMDRDLKGSVSAGFRYARTTQANELLLTRTKSDEFRGNGRIDYFYSEKTGLRMNTQFRVSDFKTTGFNSIDSYSVGAGLLYRYSPKLVANLTYDYSPEKATNLPSTVSDPSSDNHRISVGFEGEIRPKLNGSIDLGMAYRSFSKVGGSDKTFLLGSRLSWTASEKTNLTLTASNNFDTTPGAESVKSFNGALGVRQALTDKISLSGNVGYQNSTLDKKPGPVSRRDHALLLGANMTFRISDHYNANAGVTHRINNSSLALADYNRTVFSVGLNAAF